MFKKQDENYLAPAVVHIASRLEDEPRTQKMIVDQVKSQNNLFNQQDDIKRSIRSRVQKIRRNTDLELSLVRSEQYLEYIVSKINQNIPEKVIEEAQQNCRMIEDTKGIGRSKVAIAGCSLKAALNQRLKDKTITPRQFQDVTAMHRNTFSNNVTYFEEQGLLNF